MTFLANNEIKLIHGHNRRKQRSKEYRLWAHIRGRCNNPTDAAYKLYGGRGIKVCEKWSVFSAFLADVGPAPSPSHTLDRIDNDGNYEPGNVRWTTPAIQSRNTRRNIVVDGMCLKDYCAKHGLSYEAEQARRRRDNRAMLAASDGNPP